MRKEKKSKILEALRCAELAIRKLHPDTSSTRISDEAFSVIKHLDDARVLLDTDTNSVWFFDSELKGTE